MKVIGIIAEYNPIHLGHIYQINKIKEQFPDSIIIVAFVCLRLCNETSGNLYFFSNFCNVL